MHREGHHLKKCGAFGLSHGFALSQEVSRRAALSLAAGAAVLLGNARPSQAAFGEAAAVFKSKPTNTSGALCAASGRGAHPTEWLRYRASGNCCVVIVRYVRIQARGGMVNRE